MRQCAFLTMDNLDGFPRDDLLLFSPMKKRGWKVQEISWHRRGVNWGQFDFTVIRSTWDYQYHLGSYRTFLETVDASATRLENPIELVKWNIEKTYLKNLADKGVRVVPTIWHLSPGSQDIRSCFDVFESDRIVAKPTVGASSHDAFLLSKEDETNLDQIKMVASERLFMFQPFMENVQQEGEFSLIFFGGEYSHTVLKKPRSGDFRVQEEHGGTNQPVVPEARLLNRALQAVASLDVRPLYARADLVRDGNDFSLMELELVEPSLYLHMDPDAPERFADVLDMRGR